MSSASRSSRASPIRSRASRNRSRCRRAAKFASWSRAKKSRTKRRSCPPRTSRAGFRKSSNTPARSRVPSSARRAPRTTRSEKGGGRGPGAGDWGLVTGTVGGLSERDLIARIQQQLPSAPDWLLVGIGDDAAVVEPPRNLVEVLTVDALVEGIHFDRAWVPPDAIGHRALAVNLSDLAAMGAAPRLALLSLALPPLFLLDDFDGLIGGLARLAAHHRLHVVGGNLTRSPGPLMIDVTVVGAVKRRQALTRSGARPGDDLYVSGTLGAAAAGLAML